MSVPVQAGLSPAGTHGTLARTGTLSFLLVMAGSVLAFGTTLMVGNLLGADGTGTFFQITACFAILTTVCTLGADTGLVRFLSASRARGRWDDGPALLRAALIPVIVVSVCVGVALWIIAPDLSERWLPGSDAAAGIRVAAPFVLFSTVLAVLFGALRGSRRVVRFAVLQNLVLPVLRLGALGAAVLAGAAVHLLAAAWVLPLLIVVVLASLSLRQSLVPQRASAKTEALNGTGTGSPAGPDSPPSRRSFWSFSSARGVSAGIEVLLEWVGVLAVAILLGPAAAGVFGVINRCIRLGTMLDHTARIVSGPSLSESLAVGDTGAAGKLFNSITRLLILGAWPLYLVFILFGEPVLRFFGPDFENGAPVFAVSAAAMLIVVTAGGVQSVLLMSGRSRWQLLNKAAALVTAVGLNILLLPVLGLTGAAVAWAAAALVDVGLATFQVRKFLGIGTRMREICLPASLALAVFGIGGLIVRQTAGSTFTALLIMLIGGGAVYAGLLVLLRQPLGLSALLAKPRVPRAP